MVKKLLLNYLDVDANFQLNSTRLKLSFGSVPEVRLAFFETPANKSLQKTAALHLISPFILLVLNLAIANEIPAVYISINVRYRICSGLFL